MNKQAFLQETYDSAFNDELEKISAAQCPGSKIRSKGKGQGKGYGKTKGPIGVPIKKKKDMNKQAFLEEAYNSALNDELEKIADDDYKYYCPSCDYESNVGGICPQCGDDMIAGDLYDISGDEEEEYE